MEFMKINKLIEQITIKLYEPLFNNDSLIEWKTQMFTLIDKIGELKLVSSSSSTEKTHTFLDPIDWSSAQYVAHKVLDSSLEYFKTIRDRPVWQPTPIEIRETIEREPIPKQGQSLEKLCHDTFTLLL